MFELTDTYQFVAALLPVSDKAVLQEWQALPDQQQLPAISVVNHTRVFAQKNLYQTIKQLVPDTYALMPVTAFIVAWEIRNYSSLAQVTEYLKKEQIPRREQVAFSEIKPLVTNSLDVLSKVFLIFSFNDAAVYIQVAKVVANVDRAKADRFIKDLKVAHANFASILSWYKMAAALEEARALTLTDQAAAPEITYPSPEYLENMINTTVSIFREMKLFGTPILKMLAESPNVENFFITLDAVLMALTTKQSPDFMIMRRKIAFYYTLRDFIDDTGYWIKNQADQVPVAR